MAAKQKLTFQARVLIQEQGQRVATADANLKLEQERYMKLIESYGLPTDHPVTFLDDGTVVDEQPEKSRRELMLARMEEQLAEMPPAAEVPENEALPAFKRPEQTQ